MASVVSSSQGRGNTIAYLQRQLQTSNPALSQILYELMLKIQRLLFSDFPESYLCHFIMVYTMAKYYQMTTSGLTELECYFIFHSECQLFTVI